MNFTDLKAWLDGLRVHHKDRSDIISVISSLEAILAEPYNDLTISTINTALISLIEINAKKRIKYPEDLTAGMLYESFQKDRIKEQFVKTYPQIVEKASVETVAAPVKKIPVALLDVDNTLIFERQSGEIQYNDNLINALLGNNVLDVYIFSSMALTKEQVKERQNLVNYLISKGLKVHGVMCASDLVWNKDKELLKEFHANLLQTNNEDLSSLLNQEKFQSLTNFDDAVPCAAFATVENKHLSYEEAQQYQLTAASIVTYLKEAAAPEHQAIYETEKSHFYQMFVKNKPEWVGDVILVDDAKPNISAVAGMHKKLGPEHKLLTVLNRGANREVENPSSFYQELIAPFIQLINEVNDAFNRYKSERRFTHNSDKNEILGKFEEALGKCKTKDSVTQKTNEFRGKYYEQLNAHRFAFWSEDQTRSAVIFDEMAEKRVKQLSSDEKTEEQVKQSPVAKL